MKNSLLCALLISLAAVSWSQTDITLKINHRLDLADFALDMPAVNNLGQSYKTNRLEYYISKFIIIHDGGIETAVPLDVIALVQPGEEVNTLIPLGNFDVTTVESIQFAIGVYEPINNEDPTLFDESHPLGPKSPSMHWGWVAGYRFVAYEGFGGADYTQNFQLHGLGNDNYFSQKQDVIAEVVGGTLVLSIDANYTEALRDIDLSSGVVSHGETGAALQLLLNFKNHVFGNYFVALDDQPVQSSWLVYPNPSASMEVAINFQDLTSDYRFEIVNILGESVNVLQITENNMLRVQLPSQGIYFFSLMKNNTLIETKKVVIY